MNKYCFHPSSSFISVPNYMCDKVSWTQDHPGMIQNCISFEFNPPINSFVDALFPSFTDSSGQSYSWTKFIQCVWGLCCCHLFFPRANLGKSFTCTNTKRKKTDFFFLSVESGWCGGSFTTTPTLFPSSNYSFSIVN